MKKILAFDITSVLRNTIEKIESCYVKEYPNKEIVSPIIPHKLLECLSFDSSQDLYNFLEDHYLEIFGTAREQYKGVMFQFKELTEYLEGKGYKVILLTKELDKMRPATLYFLSCNACTVSNITFVEKNEEIWENCDIYVTANHAFIEAKTEGKTVIKVKRYYNEDLAGDFEVDEIKEIFEIL